MPANSTQQPSNGPREKSGVPLDAPWLPCHRNAMRVPVSSHMLCSCWHKAFTLGQHPHVAVPPKPLPGVQTCEVVAAGLIGDRFWAKRSRFTLARWPRGRGAPAIGCGSASKAPCPHSTAGRGGIAGRAGKKEWTSALSQGPCPAYMRMVRSGAGARFTTTWSTRGLRMQPRPPHAEQCPAPDTTPPTQCCVQSSTPDHQMQSMPELLQGVLSCSRTPCTPQVYARY